MIIANDNHPAHALYCSLSFVYKGIMISMREHLLVSGGRSSESEG